MKFMDFQAPVLFSSTFKALNLGEKNSRTFNDFQGCVGTMKVGNNRTNHLFMEDFITGQQENGH